MTDTAVFMAGNFIYAGFFKFHRCLIDVSIDGRQVHILFTDVESVDYIF